MATASSLTPTRVQRRRAAVIEEALDHAVAIMGAEGVGALSVSEVARRMGMRGPSLYKYFPSLHALYDALFARGLAGELAAAEAAVAGLGPGLPRIRAGAIAVVRWAVENPALAQLLHWRPVPGFEPSPETFAPSRDDMAQVRADCAQAAALGQAAPAFDSDAAVRLLTVVLSGLISQQLANEPGASFEDGAYSRLTGLAIDQFLAAYAP
ncbi:TetR/AcrR family transcriptional regulator [Geodermatophilus sp. YIM 151500]|uniref:TetR/AcrR family transcriptional regulator n=1 Tax=Geodermatophilus sp. YIM 151500 TaxID=2984531 RepID=UPI0021E3D401|nr:TetR/AcrR family transcriptional regulator [Geodermatophilus sp. YIM 151500]MCV2488176.1 TetR/AcrR family transcriptional regulator [Geodermatophilus sp. YIM 151500]